MEEIKIGSQIWMNSNLDVSIFNNGDPIDEIKSDEEWKSCSPILHGSSKPASCHYNNSTNPLIPYGKLYNWHAVNDSRGLAPEGWRVATIEDWEKLFVYLGDNFYDKIMDGNYWRITNQNPGCLGKFFKIKLPEKKLVNDSGLNILPSGYRDELGTFYGIDSSANFWCANQNEWVNEPFTLRIDPFRKIYESTYRKGEGRSVRCIKII
jgi:uncharacterized protein (TIGR02145 family)